MPKKQFYKHAAVDTETTGLDRHHGCLPFMVQMSDDIGNRLYWQWDVDPQTRIPNIPDRHRRQIRSRLLNTETLVFQNAKFDVGMLLAAEIITETQAYRILENCEDTAIMAHTIRSDGSLRLEDTSIYYLDLYDDNTEGLHQIAQQARTIAKANNIPVAVQDHPMLPSMTGDENSKWWMADFWLIRLLAKLGLAPPGQKIKWLTIVRDYGLDDTDKTLALFFRFQTIFRQNPDLRSLWKVYNRRRKCLGPLFEMEQRGMHVSKENYDFLLPRNEEILSEQLKDVQSYGLDNPDSSPQVVGTMANYRIRSTYYTKTGQQSFNKDAVEELIVKWPDTTKQGRFLRSFQAYKKLSATLGYLRSYKKYMVKRGPHNRESYSIHPSYKIPGTSTTRLASLKPGGQQWGKKKDEEGFNNRFIVTPPKGYVYISGDYSNIELRIFAYGSGDEQLIDCYETGKKVHLVFAEKLWTEFDSTNDFPTDYPDLYGQTKNGNFSLIYGASEKKADATYGKKGAYKGIRHQMPKIDEFLSSKHLEAVRNGFITTLGESRLFVSVNEPHKAVNYYCQGSAGDALLMAIPRIWPLIKELGGWFVSTIHDQIIFCVPKEALSRIDVFRKIKRLMESPGKKFGFPIPVDMSIIDDNWSVERDFDWSMKNGEASTATNGSNPPSIRRRKRKSKTKTTR